MTKRRGGQFWWKPEKSRQSHRLRQLVYHLTAEQWKRVTEFAKKYPSDLSCQILVISKCGSYDLPKLPCTIFSFHIVRITVMPSFFRSDVHKYSTKTKLMKITAKMFSPERPQCLPPANCANYLSGRSLSVAWHLWPS